MKLKHFVSLFLAAGLLACILTSCGGTSSSGASASSGADSAASAASSEGVPDTKSEASASGILPSDDENSILSVTDPNKALESCVGWGAGTAGTSLKAVVGAADMLHWAEENNLARQSAAAEVALEKWYNGLSKVHQEGFSEAWPLIKEDASQMLTNKEDIADLIDTAGLSIKDLPGCTLKNWETLRDIMDDIVPESKTPQ